jgi:hypothetical protein
MNIPSDLQVTAAAIGIGLHLELVGYEPDIGLHQGFVIVERFLTGEALADEKLLVYQELYAQCHDDRFGMPRFLNH